MAKVLTTNKAAADVVQRVIRYVQREMRRNRGVEAPITYIVDGYNLINWLKDWDKRDGAKAGGVVKKAPAKKKK